MQEAEALEEKLSSIHCLPGSEQTEKKQAVARQDIYMITPYNFSICDITDWVLDTGIPYHIYNSLQGLQVSRRFEQDERFLNVGDGRSVPVLALGILKLVFESHTVVLNDYHFCSNFFLNIISVSLLAKK